MMVADLMRSDEVQNLSFEMRQVLRSTIRGFDAQDINEKIVARILKVLRIVDEEVTLGGHHVGVNIKHRFRTEVTR